jgi:hypothetical protein
VASVKVPLRLSTKYFKIKIKFRKLPYFSRLAPQLHLAASPQGMLHSDFSGHPSAFNRPLGAHGWIGTTWQKRCGGERSMFERSSASDRHHTERGYFANKFGATVIKLAFRQTAQSYTVQVVQACPIFW